MITKISAAALMVFCTVAQAGIAFRVSADDVYTLYRSGVGLPAMRGHVATFDADEGEWYNRENCEIARDLFAHQPGVTVRYWCEPGYYARQK
jgi:hypothetical protein